MNYEEIISFLVKEKQSGKSYSEIRRILEKQNIDTYRVTQIIKEVDALVIEKESNKYNLIKAKGLMLLGVMISLIQIGFDSIRGVDVNDIWSLFLSIASLVGGGVVFVRGFKSYKKYS